ncbi:hypothetical protein [uncultured Kordia sp.]|uniref:hypothetical protein n=1 Tax=uncultured Kordia sp. TaxID=507699 RepID=UPI00263766B3|nr:hypothetical protein [uncultured Kordia sp.]
MEDVYCPACKEEIKGKYCSECGTKGLHKSEIDGLIVKNWWEEKDLKRVVENSEVQDVIKHYLAQSKKSISADDFLHKMDTIFSPLTGVSLKKVAEVSLPIYKRLGVKTGKSKTVHYTDVIQKMLLKILCSLAKNNYPLIEAKQAVNGMILIGEIPSDMKTFGGEVVVSLKENEEEIEVRVDAKIKGQLFDWGKSKSVIKNIYKDIEEFKLDLTKL